MSRNVRHLVVLAAAALAACSDAPAPTAPALPAGGPALLLWNPPIIVDLLQRVRPLDAPISTTAVVGRNGGVMRLPAAGLTFNIPPNALAQPTQITVTALPGSGVAYVFKPHGLVFRKPAHVTQDLNLTAVLPELLFSLEGAYFRDASQIDPATGTVRVSETRPTRVDLLGLRATFSVEHFSGYAVSSRRGGYIGSSGDRIPTRPAGF